MQTTARIPGAQKSLALEKIKGVRGAQMGFVPSAAPAEDRHARAFAKRRSENHLAENGRSSIICRV
jgi:hypothetical protein